MRWFRRVGLLVVILALGFALGHGVRAQGVPTEKQCEKTCEAVGLLCLDQCEPVCAQIHNDPLCEDEPCEDCLDICEESCDDTAEDCEDACEVREEESPEQP